MQTTQTDTAAAAGTRSAVEQPLDAPLVRGFSGAFLKKLAMGLMVIDHLGAIPLMALVTVWGQKGWPGLMWLVQVSGFFRAAGRLAFPIFCFLVVQGFTHTRSFAKYAGRLALFALLSEIPFDLAVNGRCFDWSGQNVFFTLLLGLVAVWWLRRFAAQKWLAAAGLLACMAAAWLIRCDYSFLGVALIALFYLLADRPRLLWPLATILLLVGNVALYFVSSFLPGDPLPLTLVFSLGSGITESTGALAFAILHCYNGQKGRQGHGFYLFYPLQFLVMWGLALLVQLLA